MIATLDSAIFKRCACGQMYNAEQFAALAPLGKMRRKGQPALDLRNCACGSTLAVEIQRKARKPAKMITASSSRCFHFCPRKYRHAYVDGLRPLVEAIALRFGSLIHLALAAWWLRQEWAPGECDPFDLAKARALMAGYDARWSPAGYEVIAIEAPFKFPLRDGSGKRVSGWDAAGKMDGVVLDVATRRKLVLEHKSSSEDVSAGSDYWQRLNIDGQISIYTDGAASLGHAVEGTLYDVLKKPGVRDGAATALLDEDGQRIVLDATGQRVKTAKGTWRQTGSAADGYTMQTRPETPEEYGARCIEAIAENPNAHFARSEVVRLDGELCAARDDLAQTARMIDWCGKHNSWPRNDNACFEYGRCPYWGLCSGTGSEHDFRKIEDTHPELGA